MLKSLHSRHQEILLELLRGKRKALRLRQADLAERLGVAQATVSKVESGERGIDIIELRQWLAALELDFVEFIDNLDRKLGEHPFPAAPRSRGVRRVPMDKPSEAG